MARKPNGRSSRRVSKLEAEYATESSVLDPRRPTDAAILDRDIDIDVERDEPDVIAELRESRAKNFKRMENSYVARIDEYAKKRASGKQTIMRSGKPSRVEPAREKRQEKQHIGEETLRRILQGKEILFSPDNQEEFERMVRKTIDYTNLIYNEPDLIEKTLFEAFYLLNELGWDISNICEEDDGEELLKNGVQLKQKGETHHCFHFTYFGEVVKPSRSGTSLASFNPVMDTLGTKLMVLSTEGDTVKSQSCPFEILLFVKSNREKETGSEVVHMCVINSGYKIK